MEATYSDRWLMVRNSKFPRLFIVSNGSTQIICLFGINFVPVGIIHFACFCSVNGCRCRQALHLAGKACIS